jgi:hypothetical protein
MDRQELLQRLKDLDEEASLLFDPGQRLKVILVGGGALVLLELLSRATHDLDVLDASRQLQSIMGAYDMNANVQTYVNNFPYNYETRVVKLMEGKLIDFYSASLEDIVIAKLYSFRATDHADITDPAIVQNLDWELLHHLAVDDGEAHSSALNETRYQEFLQTFYEYERSYRPCEG